MYLRSHLIPYALIVAGISLGGYVVLGFTESLAAGLGASSVLFVISVIVLRYQAAKPTISS